MSELKAPEVNEIRITVSGKSGVGKTAVTEAIATILAGLGLVVCFDPESFNMVEQGGQMRDTTLNQDCLAAIVARGNLLVVMKETGIAPA